MNDPIDLPQAREVCPTTARRMIGDGALLIDVRERQEIAQLAFDVPDRIVMPLSELEHRFAELPRDRDLVLACQSGARSLKATYFLMYQGYSRVANLEGGIFKWASKGFPVRGRQAAIPAAAESCCGPVAKAPACCDATAATAAPARGCCSPSPDAGARCC